MLCRPLNLARDIDDAAPVPVAWGFGMRHGLTRKSMPRQLLKFAFVLPGACVVGSCLIPRSIPDAEIEKGFELPPLPHLSLQSAGVLHEFRDGEVIAVDSFHVYLAHSGGRVLHSFRELVGGERIESWVEVDSRTRPVRGWQRFIGEDTCLVSLGRDELGSIVIQMVSARSGTPLQFRFDASEQTLLKLASSVTETWLMSEVVSTGQPFLLIEPPLCPSRPKSSVGVTVLRAESNDNDVVSGAYEVRRLHWGNKEYRYWLSSFPDYFVRRMDAQSGEDVRVEVRSYWTF